jgi:hypothetical protein
MDMCILYSILGVMALGFLSVIILPIMVVSLFLGFAGLAATVGKWMMIRELKGAAILRFSSLRDRINAEPHYQRKSVGCASLDP